MPCPRVGKIGAGHSDLLAGHGEFELQVPRVEHADKARRGRFDIRVELLPAKRGAVMIRCRGAEFRFDRRIAEKLKITMRIVLDEPVTARAGIDWAMA